MSSEKTRFSRSSAALIFMGVLLAAVILYTALSTGGSAKAIDKAADKIWQYIDSRYAHLNIMEHGKKPVYIGAGTYTLLAEDADCEDIYFYVTCTNGKITDDYSFRVNEMTNTLLRLEKEMGEYFEGILEASCTDIISVEVTFPPRVRNDIPDSVYPGAKFDPTLPIYRGSTMTLVCSATDDMQHIAKLIGKAHTAAADNGTLISSYDVYGVENGGIYTLEIIGVDADTASSEHLPDILSDALEGNHSISTSDISVCIYNNKD